MPLCYHAYGLSIVSDIALPGLVAAEQGTPDVEISQGEVLCALDLVSTETLHWSANAHELILDVKGTGRFHVRDGHHIRYQLQEGSSKRIEPFLLGSCLGAILHQRGQTVIHGSAVEIGGRAFAICGKSGAGKSTTAAHLIEGGAKMLSDDLAVIEPGDPPLLLPGYPQAKLSDHALASLENAPREIRALPVETEKVGVDMRGAFSGAKCPIAGIFILQRSAQGDNRFVRISRAQAMKLLLKHTYRRHFVVRECADAQFQALANIIRQVPVYLCHRRLLTDSTAMIVSSIKQIIETLPDTPPEPRL